MNPLQHLHSLLHEIKEKINSPHEIRTFENILALFLSVNIRCSLGNLVEKSKSTASRWFNRAKFDESGLWKCIQQWQLARLESFERGKAGRKSHMLLRIDLTSIEKTGKKLPFMPVFNKVKGIHLVVLPVSIARLSFPLAYRIYEPKQTYTPIELALQLLQEFPAKRFAGWSTWLLVDSGFYSVDFIDQAAHLGYPKLSIGARDNLILSDGRRLKDCTQGEGVELDSYPGKTLFVAYVDLPRNNTLKRFFVLCTQKASAATLRRRYSKRWLIEAFFKSCKHDFGLKEVRLRSEVGIRRWILMSFLAFSLASFVRAHKGIKLVYEATKPTPRFIYTLAQAAQQVLENLLWVYQNRVRLKAIYQHAHSLGLSVHLVPHVVIHHSYICNS
jgi:hypothetical protein